MKNPLILFLLLLPLFAFAQTKLITVRHNGASSYYSTIDSASFFAQAGDTLIFPGGDFPVPAGNGGWVINKRLHIMGAGYRPDSSGTTGPTRIVGLVTVGDGASNGSVHGMHFMVNMIFTGTVTQYLINRCAISEWLELSQNTSFLTVRESLIFKSSPTLFCFRGANSTNISFFNCIFYNGMKEVGTGSVFENCIFHVNGIGTCNYASFRNCIFLYSYSISTLNTYNTYTNCVFSNAPNISGTNSTFNCIYNADVANMFYLSTNANIIANDYRLKPNTPGGPGVPAFTNPAFGAGINGTDCGVYGGSFPLKNNAHPAHPRIKLLQVAPATNSTGNLTIRARVEAQNN